MAVSRRFALAALVAACIVPLAVLAQAYPTRPITIVVPFPPGGATDILARILGQKVSEILRQPILVDNRAGATGAIGLTHVAKAAPDGYTLVLATASSLGTNPAVTKVPFDPVKDFTPIGLLAAEPMGLAVNPSVPANNVQELIAYAKTKPGGLNYAASSVGGATHLTGELFKTAAGIQLQHIPYKGAAPAMTDLLGGQVPMMFDVIPTALAHVRSGRLKAIAVTSARRTTVMPEVPTIAESGIPGFEAISWFGLYAPAATPKETVNKLNADFNRVLQLPEVKDKLAAQGAEAIAMTPEQFAGYLRAEIAKWAKAIKDSGAKAE